jgi:TetR/AcrR family tetracycline transcriptional repressor
MDKTSATKEGGRERNLERSQIVDEALKLLDEVGYSGLTLRKLAERLHVQAAALYWHVKNKQDLIDAMASSIILGAFEHQTEGWDKGWRTVLTIVARTNRKALMSHRDGAQIMAHANMRQTNMLDGMEALLKLLKDEGFSDELAIASFFTIVRFTLGCVFEEQADPRASAPQQAIDEHLKGMQEMSDRYPVVSATFKNLVAGRAHNPDFMFEHGLALVLDGIAHQLEGLR